MKEPTVSIIVPAYRRLTYLREALLSALGQTYRDFELIVSDDGASDEIAAAVAALGDERLRYRRNEKNLGIAMNNFAAFSEARGRYLASLHDDDLWEPGFLATLVPLLEADETLSVAFCDHHIVDGEGRLLPEKTEANTRFFERHRLKPGRSQPFLKEGVVDQVIPMAMAAVFRKSILAGGDYPARIGGSYDHWLAWLAVRDGQACAYVPQRLTRYRLHDGSGTVGRGVRVFRDAIYVRKKLLADARLARWRAVIRNGLGVFYGNMALHYLDHGSPRRGRLFFLRALQLMNRPRNMLALTVKALGRLGRKSPG